MEQPYNSSEELFQGIVLAVGVKIIDSNKYDSLSVAHFTTEVIWNKVISKLLDENNKAIGFAAENERLKELNDELLKSLIDVKQRASKILGRFSVKEDDDARDLDNTLCEAIDVIAKSNELNQNK